MPNFIISYCSLSIFSYPCYVNVKDSVLDVCIRGGTLPSISSLVRHFSPHSYGIHIIWAVFCTLSQQPQQFYGIISSGHRLRSAT
ncbi:MAG: hypothetical protein SOY91_00200 [Candidatus Onthomorpha sp.]|nr:hypothetical protein [Candidatus Onthomorpha sp.]